MKKSTKKQIAINRARYRIEQAEKEERRLRALSKDASKIVIPVGSHIGCQNCGKTVVKKASNQVYCSSACRLQFQKRFPISEKFKRWKADRMLDPLKDVVKQHRLGKFFGKCLICMKEFERRSPVQKYCPHHGKKMQSSSYRRRVMRRLAEQIAREQVEGGFGDDL